VPSNNKPPVADSGEAVLSPAADVVMIYATFPDRDQALGAGRELVTLGLAGCVNVLPVMTSIYVWKGVTETSEEAVLIAKLAREGADKAVEHIRASHAYEMPAILVIPVLGGNPAYLDWVRGSTTAAAPVN
jgi:periplasmic divalent cation tolerance protein